MMNLETYIEIILFTIIIIYIMKSQNYDSSKKQIEQSDFINSILMQLIIRRNKNMTNIEILKAYLESNGLTGTVEEVGDGISIITLDSEN